MGRRGPAPKPTVLRILHGSDLPKNQAEPMPQGIPTCPGYLSDRAKEIWNERAHLLTDMKVLTEADGDALTAYVGALAILEDITVYFKTHTRVVTSFGQAYLDPRIKLEQQALKTVKEFGDRFGLNPAARTRVAVAPAQKLDANKKSKARFF